jgi:acetoin utilization protein AcuB
MAKDILTVDENASVMRATRIMKDNNVRRLPVLAHGKVVGLVTDRDLKEASPSKSSSLDIHELYYLLSEMKVKEVMTPTPICLKEDDSLEMAAMVMLENKISGVLVENSAALLVGLLSETDVLRAFLHCTGIKDGAVQYIFDVPDVPGSVTKIIDLLRQQDARVLSILTSFDDAPEGMKRVAIRISVMEGKDDVIHKALADQFTIVFHGRDELKNLPRKQGQSHMQETADKNIRE